ncbi:EAL domain-containing protein [Pediococcus claussenii]|uniref:Diguanylate cyclase/phosphodiesterase n=1 Tax=Pediococcus claussenii (strain ATCC BAA-344 / DSM 14800 / JCM 18046 / KCTC 3811 / LMG 21948 / P06) TaxID=701521 RepID=G8PC61_PEDCP|nr:EAL domain-containing protein [Pediococcus claussenii]AEV94880.1 Diguanylate cyclase/phosphodiesterase [Pediococcus claussenii ATCC BAA-344]ANZ70075.1 hypothetical protein AYR57_06980 [Pediococcus claussenii]ANZ71890.1 hypothetical protein AYR58_06980 [Pediococcus claussenii]KRN21058.1 hypothetical protein IV79_GL000284 [Pediococcus claussenii]
MIFHRKVANGWGANMEDTEKINSLCTFRQPIFDVGDGRPDNFRINGYEILLRKLDEETSFPTDLFKRVIKDDQSNALFLKWLGERLEQIFKVDTYFEYSINLDPQQLTYESTFDFLNKMKVFSSQLTIEITEAIPLKREVDGYFDYSLVPFLKRIKLLGFKLALDDVSSGINSLNMVWRCTKYISRIKLSVLHIEFNDVSLAKKIINLWDNLSKVMNVELVIEGIESREFRDWISKNTDGFQQGYILAYPSKLG